MIGFLDQFTGDKNMPISADQTLQTLGPDKIQKIAQKIGMSNEDLSQHLSQLLRQIVDKLTPNADVPSPSVLEDGLNMLKTVFSVNDPLWHLNPEMNLSHRR